MPFEGRAPALRFKQENELWHLQGRHKCAGERVSSGRRPRKRRQGSAGFSWRVRGFGWRREGGREGEVGGSKEWQAGQETPEFAACRTGAALNCDRGQRTQGPAVCSYWGVGWEGGQWVENGREEKGQKTLKCLLRGQV